MCLFFGFRSRLRFVFGRADLGWCLCLCGGGPHCCFMFYLWIYGLLLILEKIKIDWQVFIYRPLSSSPMPISVSYGILRKWDWNESPRFPTRGFYGVIGSSDRILKIERVDKPVKSHWERRGKIEMMSSYILMLSFKWSLFPIHSWQLLRKVKYYFIFQPLWRIKEKQMKKFAWLFNEVWPIQLTARLRATLRLPVVWILHVGNFLFNFSSD